MLSWKLLFKLLNATSAITVSGILLGFSLPTSTMAMESDEEVGLIHSKKIVPFSADEVLAYAVASPEVYEVDFLMSKLGRRRIHEVFDAIQKNEWPENIKDAWDVSNFTHNISLICEHLSQEYKKKFQDLSFDERIVQKLQVQELLEGTPQKIKVITPRSMNTDRVIFITDVTDKGSQKLAAKIFKGILPYEEEKGQFLLMHEYVNIVTSLSKEYDKKLPLLMEYKGTIIESGKGVILLTKTKGKSIKEISNGLPETPDAQVQKIFNNIGAQLGHLDSLSFIKNKNRLIHPDSHLENFTYDEKTDQLYWLDTAGLKLKETRPSLNDFSFASRQLRELVLSGTDHKYRSRYDNYKSPPYESFSEEEIKDVFNTTQKYLLALKSTYEGYGQAMKENKLDTSYLRDEYRKLFDQDVSVRGGYFRLEYELKKMNRAFEKWNLPPIELSKYKSVSSLY